MPITYKREKVVTTIIDKIICDCCSNEIGHSMYEGIPILETHEDEDIQYILCRNCWEKIKANFRLDGVTKEYLEDV